MAREPWHTGVRMQMICSRDARLQSDAIRRAYTRCAAIRRNQARVHEMCCNQAQSGARTRDVWLLWRMHNVLIEPTVKHLAAHAAFDIQRHAARCVDKTADTAQSRREPLLLEEVPDET